MASEDNWQKAKINTGPATSDQDARRILDRAMKLVIRHDRLLDGLKDKIHSDLSRLAKEFNALGLLLFFLEGDHLVFQTGATIQLIRPLVARLADQMTRESSIGANGKKKKPAAFTLTKSIPRGYLVAAADILISSGMSHRDTEAWLGSALRRNYPGLQAATVMNWRDETVARMGAPQESEDVMDIMTGVLRLLRPMRAKPVSRDEAQKTAKGWVEMAQRDGISPD